MKNNLVLMIEFVLSIMIKIIEVLKNVIELHGGITKIIIVSFIGLICVYGYTSASYDGTATCYGYGAIGDIYYSPATSYRSGKYKVVDSGGIIGTLYKTSKGKWFIANDNQTIEVDGRPLFGNDYSKINQGIPKSVNLSGEKYKVDRIGSGTYYRCKSLVKIKIPKHIVKIEDNAFEGCSELLELMVPKSTEVSKYAIVDCPKVEIVYY